MKQINRSPNCSDDKNKGQTVQSIILLSDLFHKINQTAYFRNRFKRFLKVTYHYDKTFVSIEKI